MTLRRTVLSLLLPLALLMAPAVGAGAGEPQAPPEEGVSAWSSASRGEAWPLPRPSAATGGYVAKVLMPSRGRTRLKGGGQSHAVSTRTSWSGQALVLLVLDSATYRGRKWVRLRLPKRPNGSAAWFRRDRMLIRHVPWWVRIRTASRTVTVIRAGRRVRRFNAVVGTPSTPTPRGLGAIYEQNRQPAPAGFIGPWALSLTFLSEVHMDFGGGPGRVAIHGRSGASFNDPLGTARSNGCIRIDNGPIRWMARKLPKGTPVRITA